jgi:hypothetical protein
MICYLKRKRWKLERLHLSRPRLTSVIAGRVLLLTMIKRMMERMMEGASRTGRELPQAFPLGKKSSARSLPAIWRPAPALRRRAAADSVVAAAGVMETVAMAASAADISSTQLPARLP